MAASPPWRQLVRMQCACSTACCSLADASSIHVAYTARALQPLMKSQHRKTEEKLPGWGKVPNPQDWKVIDALEGDGAQGKSRIAAKVSPVECSQWVLSCTGTVGMPTVSPVTHALQLAGCACHLNCLGCVACGTVSSALITNMFEHADQMHDNAVMPCVLLCG